MFLVETKDLDYAIRQSEMEYADVEGASLAVGGTEENVDNGDYEVLINTQR